MIEPTETESREELDTSSAIKSIVAGGCEPRMVKTAPHTTPAGSTGQPPPEAETEVEAGSGGEHPRERAASPRLRRHPIR
jgi:glycine cleavage system protein P-like pyridoxal-binding family